MHIHDLRIAHEGGKAAISACLDAERITLRYSVDAPLSEAGDSFLEIGLVTAMTRAESVTVSPDIPISAKLLKTLALYQEVYATWWPQLHVVKISAPSVVDAPTRGRGVACFFSGGVDSIYSMIRHREEIDDLILCRGLDIAPDEQERWELTLGVIQAFAAEVGKRLICIETDAKARFRTDANNYSALLVSTALPLRYERLIVPSGIPYEDLIPHGSHPLTDPLLATESTDVIHDGAARRTRKTQLIAETGIGLDALRVCNRYALYNCGTCEKCLRTMSALATLGAESRMLPPFDPCVLRSLRLETFVVSDFWRDNLAFERSRNRESVHAREIASMLARYDRREAFRALDERWLGGAGVRLLRSMRRLLR